MFWTSMVEEYEEIADPTERPDDQEDDLGGYLPHPSPASPSLPVYYPVIPNDSDDRIKALEMDVSLNGRYLELLSQWYRKQMAEIEEAFKNTSRVAKEQDLRQIESIQLLQGLLENVTKLVLNLSDRVSQLENEVSDRQNYLLLFLALCVWLGLLLCANHCCISTIPPATEPEAPIPKSNTYCSPERMFGTSMVEEYEEIADPSERPDDQEDDLGGNLPHPSPASPSLPHFYPVNPNDSEQNSNLMHGSSQKEAVFMTLNNCIKALEMNVSLNGRDLEQRSQRYRKQMAEIQKAFKNTSRVAKEQAVIFW